MTMIVHYTYLINHIANHWRLYATTASSQLKNPLKPAFLCANNAVIPKTHDTGFLNRQCAEFDIKFVEHQRICEELTIFATETRYPIRIEVDIDTTERLLQQALKIHRKRCRYYYI